MSSCDLNIFSFIKTKICYHIKIDIDDLSWTFECNMHTLTKIIKMEMELKAEGSSSLNCLPWEFNLEPNAENFLHSAEKLQEFHT